VDEFTETTTLFKHAKQSKGLVTNTVTCLFAVFVVHDTVVQLNIPSFFGVTFCEKRQHIAPRLKRFSYGLGP
jgi:hypothetical protein